MGSLRLKRAPWIENPPLFLFFTKQIVLNKNNVKPNWIIRGPQLRAHNICPPTNHREVAVHYFSQRRVSIVIRSWRRVQNVSCSLRSSRAAFRNHYSNGTKPAKPNAAHSMLCLCLRIPVRSVKRHVWTWWRTTTTRALLWCMWWPLPNWNGKPAFAALSKQLCEIGYGASMWVRPSRVFYFLI
jgi:hypothetical protein